MSSYRFGSFVLNPEHFTLTHDGRPLELPAIPLEILILLLRRQGGLLTRAEIAQAIWPESDPADLTHRINMAISRIRTALGDDSATPLYIQTVIGKGYRFIGSVETAAVVPAPASPSRFRHYRLPASACVLLLVVAAAWTWHHRRSAAAPVFRFDQVTFSQSEDRVTAAALSPDGEWLAYADADGVRLKRPSQQDSSPVSTPPVRVVDRLAWFSDQHHLALSGINASSHMPETWVVSVTGAAPALLQTGARRATPAPVGTRIAFADATSSSIWCRDDLAQTPRRLIQGQSDETFPVFAWSPNGKTLLVARFRHQDAPANDVDTLHSGLKTDYLAIDAETGKIVTEIADLRMDDAVLGPSGNLLFSREVPGALEIWAVPIQPDTGAFLKPPQRLQVTDKDVRSFSLAATGQMAAIIRTKHPAIQVGRFSLDPPAIADVRALSSSVHDAYPHAWSADSSSIFFEEQQPQRNYRIYRQQVDRHDPVALVSAPEDQAYPLLTPDGRWILFIARERSPQAFELYRWPIKGGRAERVDTRGPSGEVNCPLQGTKCFLRRAEGHRSVVTYSLDPVAGLEKAVYSQPWTSDDLGSWHISPDGTRAALIGHDVQHPTLQLVTMSSGQVTTMPLAVQSPVSNVQWMVDRQGWFITTRTITGSDIFCLQPGGKLTLLRQTTGISWLDPAPDGKSVAFLDQRIDSNVWLLKPANESANLQ